MNDDIDPNLCPYCYSLDCAYVRAGADCPVLLNLMEEEDNKTPPKEDIAMAWGQPLDFLFQHHGKTYQPTKWAELLGVKICDPDGWRNDKAKFDDPCNLDDFMRRLKSCTIAPANEHPTAVTDSQGNKIAQFGKW